MTIYNPLKQKFDMDALSKEKVLSMDQAAAFLNITRYTLEKLVREVIPGTHDPRLKRVKQGNRWYIPRKEIDAYIDRELEMAS